MLTRPDLKPRIAHLDRGAGDPVVLLHCSASSGRAWASLIEAIGHDFRMIVPDQWGCGFSDPWAGQAPFALADEARPIIGVIAQLGAPVHLVGHSYGGGVALHIAHRRPDLIRSLVLIEPSAFHLLRQGEGPDRALFDEIAGVAGLVQDGLATGHYWQGMQQFVDYWSGEGAWAGMSHDMRMSMCKRLGKVALDFQGLFGESTTIADFRALPFPVSIICGERSPAPSRRIVDLLSASMPDAQVARIPGAGHMSPLSHPQAVNAAIAAHLRGSL